MNQHEQQDHNGAESGPDESARPAKIHRKGHDVDGKPLRPIRPGQTMLDLLSDATTVVLRDFPPLAMEPVEIRISLGTIFTLAAQQMAQNGQLIVQAHPVKRG